jgi:hypothetical protein
MKLFKLLQILWKLANFLYDNLDPDSPVKDEADFLMELAQFLMGKLPE